MSQRVYACDGINQDLREPFTQRIMRGNLRKFLILGGSLIAFSTPFGGPTVVLDEPSMLASISAEHAAVPAN
ncbi:MAG: hypothetical protein J0H37_02790 [Hyphomicrobium denitrificans]|nr:hypothetical protein [Hyphomicrobium denitrificans]